MKIRIYLFALMLAFVSITNTASAATELTKAQSEIRVTEIKQRVDQIRVMNFSKLNKNDRVQLKHELKGMKSELRQIDAGIYISAGALILIIIILILIL